MAGYSRGLYSGRNIKRICIRNNSEYNEDSEFLVLYYYDDDEYYHMIRTLIEYAELLGASDRGAVFVYPRIFCHTKEDYELSKLGATNRLRQDDDLAWRTMLHNHTKRRYAGGMPKVQVE